MATTTATFVTGTTDVRIRDTQQGAYRGAQIVQAQEVASDHDVPACVTYLDEKCTCCPYGYHVDLDFLNFCHDLEAGSTLKNLKRIQRTKRNLRKSMEIMLNSQDGTTAYSNPSPKSNVDQSDAARLLDMINYEQSVTHNVLRHIDTSVTAMVSGHGDGWDRRHWPSDSHETHTQITKFHAGQSLMEDSDHKTWHGSMLMREDSQNSLCSESTTSSDPPLHQAEFALERQHRYRSSKTTAKVMENPVLEMATAEMKPQVVANPVLEMATAEMKPQVMANPVLEMATAEMKPQVMANPVLEMAPVEMRQYFRKPSARLLGNNRDPVDAFTLLDGQSSLDLSTATTTTRPRPLPDVDETSVQHLRESLAVSLQRIKHLEQQVKTIPILQVRISVLKEEKRMLNMQLQASKSNITVQANEHSTVLSRNTSTSQPIRTSSIGVGDHSILEPYNLQSHLPTGYTTRDNETTFEIYSREFLENERLAANEKTTQLMKRSLLQQSPHDISKWASPSPQDIPTSTQSNWRVHETQKSSPRTITRTVGVGEGNIFEDSKLQISDKEVRTLIIGPTSGPAKRNVGIECRVPSRDVGVSFKCDDLKPDTRTVGVNVSYDTSGVLTSLDFKGEKQLRLALQDVLQRSVRSVGTSCVLNLATAENGTMTDQNVCVSVGCGGNENSLDVEVRQATVRKCVGVVAKPETGHKCVNTETGWTLETGTNTCHINLYDKAVMTEKLRQFFVSTNTEATLTRPASIQTEKTVFLSMDQIKHASSNTENIPRYSSGVSTDIIATHTVGTNTVEKVSHLFQESSNHKKISNVDQQSQTWADSRHTASDKGKYSYIVDKELGGETITSGVITQGSANHESLCHDNTFQQKTAYDNSDNGKKHYSSLKVFNHSNLHDQGDVGSQTSRSSKLDSAISHGMGMLKQEGNILSHGRRMFKQEDNTSLVRAMSSQEDRNQKNMAVIHQDIKTRQSASEKVSPSSPEDRFSETVVEHFLLTKDGKKLISEETITISSAGTNRTFKQFMDDNHQATEPADINLYGSNSVSRTTDDLHKGDLCSTNSSNNYSFQTSNETNAKHGDLVTSMNSQYTLNKTTSDVQHALEPDTVDNSSGINNFSSNTNEHVYTASKQKHSRTDGMSSSGAGLDVQLSRSVGDYIPNNIRKYMSLDSSTHQSDLTGNLSRTPSQQFTDTTFSHASSSHMSAAFISASQTSSSHTSTFPRLFSHKSASSTAAPPTSYSHTSYTSTSPTSISQTSDSHTLSSQTLSSHTSATLIDNVDINNFKPSQTVTLSKTDDGIFSQLIAGSEVKKVGEIEMEMIEESSSQVELSDYSLSVFPSSSTTYSSSLIQSQILSPAKEEYAATDENKATNGVGSEEVFSTSGTDGRMVVTSQSSEWMDKKETHLKSIMKHKTEIPSICCKKGITFAETVTGGTGSSSEDGNNWSDTESSESLEESSSIGRENEASNLCKENEVAAESQSFGYNLQKTYEMSEELRTACLQLARYLTDSTSIQTKQLDTSQEVVKQEWFQLSSHKLSSVYHVVRFLTFISEISARLMEYVVNLTDANGNTAIHYSISHCNFEIVSVLLDSKVCDIDKRNKAGFTPIMLAGLVSVPVKNLDIIRRILSFGEIDAKATETQQTALMLAASHGRTEVVKLLIQAGAKLNLRDEDGSTALMCACEHGHIDIVNFLLLQPDIDVNVTDNEGSTALKIAMETNHKDIGVSLYKHLNFSKPSSSKFVANNSNVVATEKVKFVKGDNVENGHSGTLLSALLKALHYSYFVIVVISIIRICCNITVLEI